MSKATTAIPASGLRENPPGRPYPLYRYDVETAYGLAEAFGGIDGLADYTDAAPQAVKDWTISGRMPMGWHLRLFAKLAAMGKTVDPAVFGFDANAEEAQALNQLMFPAMGGAHE
jgi:hypothetical protein